MPKPKRTYQKSSQIIAKKPTEREQQPVSAETFDRFAKRLHEYVRWKIKVGIN
jgi:hypothetical protein